MEQLTQLLNNLQPMHVVLIALALIGWVNKDSLLPLLSKAKPLDPTKPEAIYQHIRQLREATCIYPKGERDAIAESLDEIDQAVQRTILESE